MATAYPLQIRPSELDIAVEKLRAEQPLTERERGIVRARGVEQMELTDEPGNDGDTDDIADDPELEEHLLEALVLSEDDERHGRGITAEEMLAQLRAAG